VPESSSDIEAALGSLGRHFPLVDFGSSLHYFPFFFGDRGATTTGLDIKPASLNRGRGVPRPRRIGICVSPTGWCLRQPYGCTPRGLYKRAGHQSLRESRKASYASA
jgi:hypothetical protein